MGSLGLSLGLVRLNWFGFSGILIGFNLGFSPSWAGSLWTLSEFDWFLSDFHRVLLVFIGLDCVLLDLGM